MRSSSHAAAITAFLLFGARAWGDEAETPYHYPQGSIAASGSIGLSFGSGGRSTVFSAGLGVGYAVFTGVVPGVRGTFIKGDEIAGETALTLLLTPPLSFPIVPFAFGEVGRRFDGFGGAWLYGGGGGLLLGSPDATFGVQLGWVFRRLAYSDVGLDASGPLIALSARF